jgi:hypothetical protein
MKLIHFVFFMLPVLPGLTQNTGVDLYKWEANRKQQALSAAEDTLTEYVIKLHRGYHYEWEGDDLVSYVTEHRITKVKTTRAIERHNRIYISMRNVSAIAALQARAINRQGKITYFDQKNLKEVKDDKTDNSYRIFAIEGVETDSEIEYYYTLKTGAKTYETLFYQEEAPIRSWSFSLVSSKKLVFDFRIYHDSGSVKSDTVKGKNRYEYASANIPALHEEPFTFYNAYRKRIEFKLAYNLERSSARLNTWASAGRVFYRSVTNYPPGTEKELKRFIKLVQDNPQAAPEARIKNVEDFVKTAIRINKNSSDPALDELPAILKMRQASAEGIAKVLFLTYEALAIPVQLVVTCNREYAKFDGGFDSWAFLDEYLLYFPQADGFLSPDEFELRYPLIPQRFSGHKGLFIEPVTVGQLKTGIGWIREIPALPFTADSDNLDIEVQFSADLSDNQIKHRRTFIGYDAATMVPYYNAISEEQRKKFTENIFGADIPGLQFDTWAVHTGAVNNLPKMELAATYHTSFFLERAGPRTLFKVGQLIGTQSELYNKEERHLPVENTHNRGYIRKIRIAIPPGYRVSNLEALKMNVEYRDGENTPFLFVSNYSENGSEIIITIEEFYKELYAPLERYEDFRKVINAAADFNKIMLVLLAE